MNKVDIVINIIGAAMNFANDPRVNTLYANVAFSRNTFQWICQGQPDNGDVMATDAVKFALGLGPKPAWMSQGGL